MRALLLVVSMLLGSACLAGADETSPSDESVQALIAKIGSPARRAAVDEALEEARDLGGTAPLTLATVLGHAGGSGGLEALTWLIRRGDESTCLQAIESAKRVDLRAHALLAALRAEAGSGTPVVRPAAYEGLGRLGDGRDVPILLDGLRSTRPRERQAAYQALRRLSGANHPPVLAKWEYWWKTLKPKSYGAMVEALDALGEEPAAAGAAVHRATIRRYGWAQLTLVEKTLKEWLYDANKDLRAEAARIAGEQRLTDLAPGIERSRRFALSAEQQSVMDLALTRLGVVSSREE